MGQIPRKYGQAGEVPTDGAVVESGKEKQCEVFKCANVGAFDCSQFVFKLN